MFTNSEFVSSIINNPEFLTKDEHVSRRHVLSVGRGKALTYISQKLKDKTLYKESHLWTPIKCLELKKDDIVKCPVVAFRRAKSLMVSKNPLPELIFSLYGPSILRVVSLDDGRELQYSASYELVSSKDREFGDKVDKYYIYDNHLYVPDSAVEVLSAEVLSLYVKEIAEACDCCDEDPCKSVWDYPFICPDKLYEPIRQETMREFFPKKQLPSDENPDMDRNQKTKTTI